MRRREKVEMLQTIDKNGIPKKSHKKEVNKRKENRNKLRLSKSQNRGFLNCSMVL